MSHVRSISLCRSPSLLACIAAIGLFGAAPLWAADGGPERGLPEQALGLPVDVAPVVPPTWARSFTDSTGLPRRWALALSIDAETSIPFGRYYGGSGIGSSLGFGVTGHLALSSRVGLRGRYARLGLDYNDDSHILDDPDVEIVDLNIGLDADFYSMGLEFYHRFRGDGFFGTHVMNYLHVSACVIRHNTSVRLTARDTASGDESTLSDSDTSIAPGFTAGAGLVRQLGSSLGLEIGIDWSTIVPEQISTFDEAFHSFGHVITVYGGIAVVL